MAHHRPSVPLVVDLPGGPLPCEVLQRWPAVALVRLTAGNDLWRAGETVVVLVEQLDR
jgi:hypothetical protein